MAGHSKWKQIKNKKATTDAQKSRIFSKVIRLITVEAKNANGNMEAPGLRAAIEKARAANMPSDNIERAIKKAKDAGGEAVDVVTYETYGPGGCAIVIEGLTSNRNKTAAEIRHILSELGFSLAGSGAATWAFEKAAGGWVPKSTVALSDTDTEVLGTLVEQLEAHEDIQDVYTNVE
ncbi:MAG: YebC/PmpR family DNA-binding transcriptional regulator [Patescibacteria group bacterium]